MASRTGDRGALRASLVFFAVALFPVIAAADGKRDLEDGIAFYENLDSERALERLCAASRAPDLGPGQRARAFLYIGMLELENGSPAKAEAAWRSAFALERGMAIPAGTSPKTIEAIEAARALLRETPPVGGGEGGIEPGPFKAGEPSVAGGDEVSEGGPPGLLGAKEGAQPALIPPPRPPSPLERPQPHEANPAVDESSGGWLLWTGVGGAAVAISVVAIVLLTGGSECQEAGGCLAVTFD